MRARTPPIKPASPLRGDGIDAPCARAPAGLAAALKAEGRRRVRAAAKLVRALGRAEGARGVRT
jgi:hypothetical protein